MKWLQNRLREPSTWRGIVWLLTVAGIVLTPEQAEAVVAAGMALAGLLGVFLPDEETRRELPPIELQAHASAIDSIAQSERMPAAVSAERESTAGGFNGR